jgi:hypothetical protein
MYLGRCRSSNNAHFMWLIEILVFPVYKKVPDDLRNSKDRKEGASRKHIRYNKIHNQCKI